MTTTTRYTDKAGQPFGGDVDETHPFKVFVHLPGEHPATNGLSYATVEDARAGGHDLLWRWLVPTGFEVRNVLTGEVFE
jgi:hypothetical protein